MTRPPDPPFVPPSPYPRESPFADHLWYGTESLWTVVPTNGVWAGLPYHSGKYIEKVFWWSEGYDWRKEPQPELTVTDRRLDAPAPPLEVSEATNAFNPGDIQSAMLVGVGFPTLGCWEITL